MTTGRALRGALERALREDERVRVLGEALELSEVTRGLRRSFPERVHLLPASDAGLAGVAMGMALGGALPVLELPGLGALRGALPALARAAAAREFSPTAVLRVPLMSAPPPGALAAILAIPGLSVVAASSGSEAVGLLEAALAGRGLTVVLEPADALEAGYPAADDAAAGESGLTGSARELTSGVHATILAWGAGVSAALEAAAALPDEQTAAVLDLRSLSPLDRDTLGAAVRHSGRAIIVDDPGTVLPCVVEEGFLRLEAPPMQVPADPAAITRAVQAAIAY